MNLAGSVYSSHLQAAFDALVTRHDALRTRFTLGEHGVRAHVVPPGTCHLHARYVQLTPDQAAQPAAGLGLAAPWLTEAVQKDTGRPFDLGEAPLLRCTIIEVYIPATEVPWFSPVELSKDQVGSAIVNQSIACMCFKNLVHIVHGLTSFYLQ